MDKPSDYMPEDVIKAAEEAVQSLEGINQYPIEWTLPIARAIMAARAEEREACAQVADTMAEVISDEIADAPTHRGAQILSTQRHSVQAVAAAIRERNAQNP